MRPGDDVEVLLCCEPVDFRKADLDKFIDKLKEPG